MNPRIEYALPRFVGSAASSTVAHPIELGCVTTTVGLDLDGTVTRA